MKDNDLTGLFVILGLALAAALGFGLWLIDGPTLQTVALILAVAFGLALLIGAGALFVRAWRKNDSPPKVIERHVIERHTIDGRTAEGPRLYQLPAPPSGGAFPDLLRAAYQSGLLASGRPTEPPIDGEARELPPDEWNGDIRRH
jgi:hypothetical protein